MTCGKFHQHFNSSFSAKFLTLKKFKAKTSNNKTLHVKLSHNVGAHKMLVKLTPVSQSFRPTTPWAATSTGSTSYPSSSSDPSSCST